MIANGTSTGRFGTGSLLSGVILSSGNVNPYLLRRAEYGPKYKPTDLIQSGPFLVDQSTPVKGLSTENGPTTLVCTPRWRPLVRDRTK